MPYMRLVLAVTALLLAAATPPPAWAVYKCTGTEGRVAFQETPCAQGGEKLDVRPASGPGERVVPTSPDAARPGAPSVADRYRAISADVRRSQRRLDIQAELPQIEHALQVQQGQCDGEIRALQASMARANNNLAGATWQVARANEMSAVARRCDTQQRELRERREALVKECAAIEGCTR